MVKRLAGFVLVTLLASLAHAADITVSAAASLQNAFTDIGKAFDAQHPGSKTSFNFAASGQLLQQTAKGAPADVLATADLETMDKAEAGGLILPGTRVNFASNTLVLVVPKGRNAVTSMATLGGDDIRQIALGTPESVPAGSYAKAALEAAGKWDALKSKYVFGHSVRQVLDYVVRGEVDAGFVYATDAAQMKDKVGLAAIIATPKPILYPIAVVKGSPHEEAARAFVELVRSEAGRKILAGFGFRAP